MNMRTPIYLQRGLSLVELMVALVISVFLLAGVIQVYTANKDTYRFSEAMSRIQENARFSLDTMARDLRMAGFWGCATYDPGNPGNIQNNLNANAGTYDSDLHNFLQPPISGTNDNGLNGSDSIRIRGSQPGQANVVAPYNSPTSRDILIDRPDFAQIGDIVLLTNCKGADIFQVTGIDNNPNAPGAKQALKHQASASVNPGNGQGAATCTGGGVNTNCLSQTYGGGSSVIRLQSVRYFVKASASGSGEPALWRNVNGQDQELVEGVEQLQILYGVNSDPSATSPNQYLTSDRVTDWNQVVAVRIMLLLRSPDRVNLDAPQNYRFNKADLVATDNRLRQVINTTIALRNQIP